MARLTAAERKKIPSSEFGMPKERKFPLEDKAHAKNAKARASMMEHEGKISKATENKIDRKADQKLGKKPEAKRSESRKDAAADRVVSRMMKR